MARKKGLEIRKGVKYTGRMRKQKLPPDIRAFFAKMGAQGGKIGGRARAERLTPERRREIARGAIAARWAKRDNANGR